MDAAGAVVCVTGADGARAGCSEMGAEVGSAPGEVARLISQPSFDLGGDCTCVRDGSHQQVGGRTSDSWAAD